MFGVYMTSAIGNDNSFIIFCLYFISRMTTDVVSDGLERLRLETFFETSRS